jgi:hypothetical protein
MLTPEEREKMTAGLEALMVRGRISNENILAKREEIAEVMRPLPPPWEWERLRLLTGMPATAMERRTSTHAMRIRHWEKGGGTQQVDCWVEYAEALTRVVGEKLVTREADLAVGFDGRETENESVRSLIEQQRVTANGLKVWLSQNVPCSQGDLAALWDAVRTTKIMTRASEKRLRERMRAAAQTAEGTGREGQDVATGS